MIQIPSKSADRWTVFWLLLPLMLVVIAGFTTWYIAAAIAPQKLPVDTLNNPKLVGVFFEADKRASRRALQADLQWNDQQFTVITNQSVAESPVRLHLSHISDASKDLYLILDPVDNTRFVSRTTPSTNRASYREHIWYVRLEAGAAEKPVWRLLGKWTSDGTLTLMPRQLEADG